MKKVLITGATGFIGGRLAEIAFERGVSVVGLVRTWSSAARLASLPVTMIQGDIMNGESLREAMKGCDVVFHCAVDNRNGGETCQQSSVQGTANVMQAALDIGVKRVVHLSSIAVYSYRPRPDSASEGQSYHYSGDRYCDGKIDAEKVALRYHRKDGLPVTILRPTIVYGPFGSWTVATIASIRKRRMILAEGGLGICNSLYVDNLVEAMLLAADCDRAIGEIFHISDAAPITWKEYIEAHACALGDSYLPLPEMSLQEIAEGRARIKNGYSSLAQTLRLIRDPKTQQALLSIPMVKRSERVIKTMARGLLPASARCLLRQKFLTKDSTESPAKGSRGGVPFLPSQSSVDIYTTSVLFSIEKARQLLSYNPKISFAEGMGYTSAWIKWARL